MKKYIYLLFYCFVCSLPLFAQENGTPRKQAISQKDIFISFDCVKHLVFPVQVSDIAIGEQELAPEIISALKAARITGIALFSPRTARISAALMEKAGLAECARGITAYCFSENVALEAHALSWAAIHTCTAPTRAAMRELIVSHHPKSE